MPSWNLVVGLALLLPLLWVRTPDGSKLSSRYAIVFDAGSSSTKLHVYEFSVDHHDKQAPYKLVNEHYRNVSPGVSNFACSPEKAADSVRQLLIEAKAIVPKEKWDITPAVLKATAGLRLLCRNASEGILDAVEDEMESSGFLAGDHSVSIMSGADEGVYGWLSLNFLLGGLNGAKKSAAVLDMGGASTQVTYRPAKLNLAVKGVSKIDYTHKLRVFGRDIRLYTHSYLGGGQNAARVGVANITSSREDIAHHRLKTHCLPHGQRIDGWEYAGKEWSVEAVDEDTNSTLARCLASCANYLRTMRVAELNQEEGMDIVAFASFHAITQRSGLVDTDGGWLQLGQLRGAAAKACTPSSSDDFWLCQDLAYAYSLLRMGYGYGNKQQINVVRRIGGKQMSWALGAALNLIDEQIDHQVIDHVEKEPTFWERVWNWRVAVPSIIASCAIFIKEVLERITPFIRDSRGIVRDFTELVKEWKEALNFQR